MDELHHENEELNQQVAKLQKENSDMKVKLATMSDDSEKLGGLKVRYHSNQNSPISLFNRRCLIDFLPSSDGAANVGGGTPAGKVSIGICQRKDE